MHPNSNSSTIALVTVAAEIGATADELAARLADDVVVDDVTGLRVVPTQRARVYLAALRAAQQAQADRRAAALAEARRRPNPTRERVKALQARESTGDPFADVLRDHLEGRLDHAAAERDELLRSEHTGGLPYHPIRNQE